MTGVSNAADKPIKVFILSGQSNMVGAGKEVYRKEVGKKTVGTEVKLTLGQKASFKITYLTKDANGIDDRFIDC